MPKIKDVAQKAGVSTATVSHVINNSRFVKPETREAVLVAIKDLNYRPSSLARSLRTNSTKVIALMVPNVSNHFLGNIALRIENLLAKQNYSLLVCNTNYKMETEKRYIDVLIARQVDGMIAAPVMEPQQFIEFFDLQKIPLVFIDRNYPNLNVPCVCTDNRQAVKTGIKYLFDKGYRKIGVLMHHRSTPAIQERLEGCLATFEELGIKGDSLIATMSEDSKQRGNFIQQYLVDHQKLDAILTLNYQATANFLKSLKQFEISYLDRIGFLTFDDDEWMEFYNPSLSSMKQPLEKISECSVKLILDLIQQKKTPRLINLFPAELKVRS